MLADTGFPGIVRMGEGVRQARN